MRKLMVLFVVVFLGAMAWRIGERLSTDAVGMGLGVLFGVMAGVPTALLLLAAGRRRDAGGDEVPDMHRGQAAAMPWGAYGHQPPVIVVTGGASPQQMVGGHSMEGYGQPMRPLLPAPATIETRQFRVVGERDESLDEW